MWQDQELHKLFRSRLPIADLPTAFADRLTHTILAEVATLRRTDPTSNAPTPHADADTPTDALASAMAKGQTRLAVNYSCLLLL